MAPKTTNPVIHLQDGQKKVTNRGGTMRLGAYECQLKEGSKALSIYGQKTISERHRHRYEFNNNFREIFEQSGMNLSGVNDEKGLVEIVEIPNHPWFIGVQFHPEYKSTVDKPHPLFVSFIQAAILHGETINAKQMQSV